MWTIQTVSLGSKNKAETTILLPTAGSKTLVPINQPGITEKYSIGQ